MTELENALRHEITEGTDKISRFTTLCYYAEGYITTMENHWGHEPYKFSEVMALIQKLAEEFDLKH